MSWVTPQSGTTIATRPAPSLHMPWNPLPYMLRGVEHLVTHRAGGLALDPGLRKTSITLAAFSILQQAGQARTMLVIAPLRVCRRVWRQEGAKWSQFRHLKFSLLHGKNKEKRLDDDADVWLINPEGVTWLCKLFFGRALPWDVVCIDELTKFKNAASDRAKALEPRLRQVKWRWGLTGSLAPNGFMDLFGQMLMLDSGAALGRYITHYRDNYFQLEHDGFTYKLMPGAEPRIVHKIAPYWLQMNADDYLTLPEIVYDVRDIEMSPAGLKLYKQMKRDMIAQLPGGVVSGANAAAVYAKLSQMANGAVYLDDGAVGVLHDDKLDALEELLEECNGEPLLCAYEFNHDIDRLRVRFGKDGKLPYLGKGTTATQEEVWINAWNRNEIPLFPCHPQSAGHGLNMQEGSAAHIAFFGPIWDLELFEQFIRRVRRSGNTAQRVIVHILRMAGTIDEEKWTALQTKDTTQGRLKAALNREIQREQKAAGAHANGEMLEDDRRLPMIARLSRQDGEAASGVAVTLPHHNLPAQSGTTGVPKGWGAAAGGQTAAPAADDGQRERIAATLSPGPGAEGAKAGFSGAVQEHMAKLAENAAQEGHQSTESASTATLAPPAAVAAGEPVRRSRAKRGETVETSSFSQAAALTLVQARVEIVKMVFADPNLESVEQGLEICRELEAYVRGDDGAF